MKIEKIGETNKYKWIIIGFIICASLFVMINYLVTKAKYRNTESVDLVKGTISYNKADLNIIAMYQESSYNNPNNGYITIDEVPTGKYKLSSKSYCTVPENEDHITDNMEFVDGNVEIKINKRGTKCYVYFDMDYTSEDMLAKLEAIKQSEYTIDEMPNPITGPYDESTENPEGKEKIYTTEDNYGTSYVFRGNNNDVNNWVTFAGHTWRIIRINGDGTLRLIFQCAEPNCTDTTGDTTNAVGGIAYKSAPYDDNTYVGYYYGTSKADKGEEDPTYEETHSNETPSNIAKAVDNWYTGTGAMTNYTKYLSGSTGFCNDRTVVKNVLDNYNGDGTGQSASGYAPASRLFAKGGANRTKQYPTLKCGVVMPETSLSDAEGFSSFDEINPTALARDLFTTSNSGRGNEVLTNPVGLITIDEVVMVGGFGGATGTNYWLYTNQYYWTMSPSIYDAGSKRAAVFHVRTDGDFGGYAGVSSTSGVRPVINLNPDIEFSGGNGKSDNPFVVNTSM